MYTKPTWVRILTETIGIPQIITFIIGVPTMIGFICVIWQALTYSHRIIAIVLGIILLGVIIMFVYFQTRKKLYIIPSLLYKMRCRCMELAGTLKIDSKDQWKLLELINMESSDIEIKEGTILNLDEFKPVAKDILDLLNMGMTEAISSDMATIDRVVEYYYDKSGLKDLLDKDKLYSELNSNLEKLRIIVPTEDINVAITQYLNETKVIGSILPNMMSIGEDTIKSLPLKNVLDLQRSPSNIKEQSLKSLAKVRESIERYYKGKK